MFFLSPLVVFAFIIDYYVTDTLVKSDFRIFKRWRELTRPINASVLVSGSSRASLHVDPSILDSILRKKTFNIGITGGPYEISDVALRIYKKYNSKHIELILCNVDFLSFNDYSLPYTRADYAPFYHDSSFMNIVETMNLSPTEKYIPCIRYGGQLTLLKQTFGIGLKWDDDLSQKKTAWREGAFLVDVEGKPLNLHFRIFERSDRRIKLFTQFLKECERDSTQVILFKSPIFPSVYNELANIEDSFLLIDSIAKVHKLALLDYTDYLVEDSTCFVDPIHLNYKGAEQFSVRLAHDVDSLLKKNR